MDRLTRGWWVAAAAVVAHVTVLGGGFVWLDQGDIQAGKALAPWGQWLGLFTRGLGASGFYRPMVALTLSLDALGGPAWVFHAQNLAWHAAAAVMVMHLAGALGLGRRAAWVSGLCVAVHPCTSVVVGAIAYRGEAMITVALAALVVFHRQGRPALAGASLLLGCLTKETALVMGPLWIAVFELAAATPKAHSARSKKHLIAAEGAALAVAMALRAAFAPSWHARFVPLAGDEVLGTRLAALYQSGITLLLPWNDQLCDATPITSVASAPALLGLLLLAGVGLAAWRGRGPAMYLGVSLLPAFNLVPLPRFWSPHYLYLSLGFVGMILGTALERRTRPWWMAAGVLACACVALSQRAGLRFASNERLFSAEAALGPQCREAHFYLAQALMDAKDWPAAQGHLEIAVHGAPGWVAYVDLPAALQNLAVAHMQQGHLTQAQDVFNQALALAPHELARRQISHNLAALAVQNGQAQQGLALLEPELARPDALPQSLYLAAKALHDLGQEERMAAVLRRLKESVGQR